MFRLQRYENFVVAANIFPLNGVFPSCKITDDTENTNILFIFRAVKPTGLQPVGCKALSLVSNIFHNCIWAGFAY